MEETPVNTSLGDESIKEDREGKNKGGDEGEHVSGKKKRRERKLKSQPKNVTGSDAPDTSGPRGICVMDFVQARAMELHNMTTAISQHGSARRTFQTLPRHMRRRSMSHNIKRLPRRLREQAKNEMVECIAKKLSRKTRRKSSKIVEEYGRRSEKCRWLESHIWHAKRFKMMEYHGYKIAERCCDKGARATYRYYHTGCLLYDCSYHGCVELLGSETDISTILQPLMNEQVGITIEAKDCLSGCRSGHVILYHSHCYPNNPIGPAQFVWRPKEESLPSRQLWLLVHPAVTKALMEEINANIKTLLTTASDNVIVTNLQDELVHYKLIGAQCNDIIVQAIDPVWSPVDEGDRAMGKWWVTRQHVDDDGMTDKKKFFDYLAHTKTPAELPNNVIVGLTVRDFRLSIPKQKVTITSTVHDTASISNAPQIVTPELCHCHIWNNTVRDCVKQNVVPEYHLNKIRSESLYHVSEELKELECYLPVLLIHQTVNGAGVGWDILLPTGWGKPLWLSLVYHGARVIGFEEMKRFHLEQQILHYPTDFPDTNVGHHLEINNFKMLQSKYCKYPPDKRPNFGKLNSSSPFQPAWNSVVSYYRDIGKLSSEEQVDDTTMLPASKRAKLSTENYPMETSFYVLRSVKCLASLSRLLDSLKTIRTVSSEETWLSLLNDMQLSTVIVDHLNSLVAISFAMCHRGNPSARSMLCIPSAEDLIKFSNDQTYFGPVELLNKKGVCIQHDEQLLIGTTSLTNKQFKSAKRELQASQVTSNAKTVNDFSHPSIQSVTNDNPLKLQPLLPSRPIIGYVTNAGYVFSQGMGSGVGFCSLLGLMMLMKFCYLQNHPVTILVRENDSLQYRFAYIEILQNHV